MKNSYPDAIAYAAKAHRGQYRDGGEAFILHPARIAWKLRTRKVNPYIATAAVLHDVVEDTGKSLQSVRRRFGSRVADVVAELTKDRDESDIDNAYRLREGSHEARLIRLYDKLDNIQGMNGWSNYRKLQYLNETERAVSILRGTDKGIEDEIIEKIRKLRERFYKRPKRNPDIERKISESKKQSSK